MYSIHSCPDGQPLAVESARYAPDAGLILHLREIRSHLSQDESVPARHRRLPENQWPRIEVGRCLRLEEKRAVAPPTARRQGQIAA